MHTPRTHPPNLRTHTPARRQRSFIPDPESMRTTVQFTPSTRLKPPFQYDWAKPHCGIPIKFYELLTACGSCAPALPAIRPRAEARSLRRPWQSPGSGASRMMTAVTSRPPFRCHEAPREYGTNHCRRWANPPSGSQPPSCPSHTFKPPERHCHRLPAALSSFPITRNERRPPMSQAARTDRAHTSNRCLEVVATL